MAIHHNGAGNLSLFQAVTDAVFPLIYNSQLALVHSWYVFQEILWRDMCYEARIQVEWHIYSRV